MKPRLDYGKAAPEVRKIMLDFYARVSDAKNAVDCRPCISGTITRRNHNAKERDGIL